MTVPVNHDIVLLPDPNVIFFSLGALNVVPRLILNARSRPSFFERRVEGRQIILHVAGRANLPVGLKRCREYWSLK